MRKPSEDYRWSGQPDVTAVSKLGVFRSGEVKAVLLCSTTTMAQRRRSPPTARAGGDLEKAPGRRHFASALSSSSREARRSPPETRRLAPPPAHSRLDTLLLAGLPKSAFVEFRVLPLSRARFEEVARGNGLSSEVEKRACPLGLSSAAPLVLSFQWHRIEVADMEGTSWKRSRTVAFG